MFLVSCAFFVLGKRRDERKCSPFFVNATKKPCRQQIWPKDLLLACKAFRLSELPSFTAFRESHRQRSAFYGLWRAALPALCDRWRFAYGDGNHACCFSCGCGVGMYVSLYVCFYFLLFESLLYVSGCKVSERRKNCKGNLYFFVSCFLHSFAV